MCIDLKPCTKVTSPPPPSLLGSFPLGYPQGHTHPSWPSHVLCNRKNDRFKRISSTFANTQISFLSSQHPTLHPNLPPKWNGSNVTWQQCPLEEDLSIAMVPSGLGSIRAFHHTGSSSPRWLHHCTHQQVEFMFSLRQLGWACDYGGSDAIWLSYLLPGSQLWSPEPPAM